MVICFCFDQARWCSVGKIQAKRKHVPFREICQIAHAQNYRELITPRHPRELIVHQQRYRQNDSTKNVDI
jgi:hypothetical protein